MENDIDFNYSECIKSYDKLGETVYQNICNGKTNTVPWGVSGYGIAMFLLVVFILLVSFAISVIKDMFW